MSKIEKQEACQLYIEQEIDSGLEEGKTPYSIGKELAVWIEKLFEVKVKPRTIEQRARRIENATNVAEKSDKESREPETQANKDLREGLECGELTECHCGTIHGVKVACPECGDSTITRGGIRKGAGRPPKFRVEEPVHRTQFTGDNEWYTPVKYIEDTREVMGGIDLDPASSVFGQSRVNAKEYYTVEENGLALQWHGRVWLNPPYSQPDIANFIDKLCGEFFDGNIQEAITLTHNYTDTEWFHKLVSLSRGICFTRGRVKYEKEDGTIAAPTQGAAFCYFGNNIDKFTEIFGRHGFLCGQITPRF